LTDENRSSHGVKLRPATADDEEVLLEIYASTRADELAVTNWSEHERDAFIRMQFAAQRAYYQSQYPHGDHKLIFADGHPAGRLYTAENDDEIRILDITVLPRLRGAGIGTPLINDLLSRAKEVGKPVRIYVEAFNRSRHLFERLGFRVIEEDGMNVLLECRPTSDHNLP
jgi:ribosomal protein S18 acetylase RimI-like enzyme